VTPTDPDAGPATVARPGDHDDDDFEAITGESRWPPVIATVLFLALSIVVRAVLPQESLTRLPYLVPAVEAVLVVVLFMADPSGRAERLRMRRAGLILVGGLVLASLWDTAELIDDLIHGHGVANEPGPLLALAGTVWLGNNLASSLLYWLIDGGGPFARRVLRVPVDFAFTQHLSPAVAPPGWRPVFLDYLHLGFTNATAFSPTDVMPLTHRAKYAMVVQSTVSLAVLGLVVARAVNAFN